MFSYNILAIPRIRAFCIFNILSLANLAICAIIYACPLHICFCEFANVVVCFFMHSFFCSRFTHDHCRFAFVDLRADEVVDASTGASPPPPLVLSAQVKKFVTKLKKILN